MQVSKMNRINKVVLTSVLALVLLVASLAIAGCSGSSNSSSSDTGEKTTIKIGLRSDMLDPFNAIKSKIEALGYTVETTMFDDSVQPDNALKEGSIDVNWYQHEPYMQAYNKSNGTNFVMVSPKTIYNVFGLYSSKWKSVDEIPDGATIGLCNDPTNRKRGLEMLEKQGLIKIKSGVESPTQYDLEENPKNLQFIEAEMSVLPQSIDDVDGICLASLHMLNAGKDASDYVCSADDNEEYAVGFVVDGSNANAKWATDIAKAAQCDELANYLNTNKKGAQIPAWE